MALFLPDEGLANVLNRERLAGALLNATLHLFTSNHTPVAGDVLATYTAIEAAFGGYVTQTISDWAAAIVASNIATSTAGVYTFTATGSGLPVTVYGVYVLTAAGLLLYAELNPTGGVTLSAAGQTFSYVPKFSVKNQ